LARRAEHCSDHIEGKKTGLERALPIRSIEARLALELISSIQADLERLRGLIQPGEMEFDPKDSRNKTPTAN
jgi:hypothetical protein